MTWLVFHIRSLIWKYEAQILTALASLFLKLSIFELNTHQTAIMLKYFLKAHCNFGPSFKLKQKYYTFLKIGVVVVSKQTHARYVFIS